MSKVQEIAISVNHVSKSFKLPHEKNTSIKSIILHPFKRGTFERQQVLDDINFDIKKGEFFGIVGRNGSGKSTLLKLLAGIYSPDKGTVQVNGKLTPFIELGVGFNPELTGRENVFLNGALLGFNRKEMLEMYDEIVEFAELEKFMDQKLKNYSSGMQVRLAFSIAIRAKTEVLLIDEVLAVGDAAFQQKCYEVFSQLKQSGVTIVLVTHDMSAVTRFCNQALLLNKGSILKIGKPSIVAEEYLKLNYENQPLNPIKDKREEKANKFISNIKLVSNGKSKSAFNTGESVEILFDVKDQEQERVQFGFQIFSEQDYYCFGTNTKIMKVTPAATKQYRVQISVKLNLLPGAYSATIAMMNSSGTTVIEYIPKAVKFRIIKETNIEGIVSLDHNWEITNV
jgi:ABC-2 type transport system ATP-binding protein